MNNLKTLNPEKVSEAAAIGYPTRKAARAVVVDEEGKIALLHVTNFNYYKLPGGGIEDNEDELAALSRECLEEIGCKIKVTGEIGQIVEYRKFCNLKQVSFCYSARLVGEKGKPNFMDDEVDEGFEALWVSYDQALSLLSNNEAIGQEGHDYVVPRDELFLKAAKDLIKPI